MRPSVHGHSAARKTVDTCSHGAHSFPLRPLRYDKESRGRAAESRLYRARFLRQLRNSVMLDPSPRFWCQRRAPANDEKFLRTRLPNIAFSLPASPGPCFGGMGRESLRRGAQPNGLPRQAPRPPQEQSTCRLAVCGLLHPTAQRNRRQEKTRKTRKKGLQRLRSKDCAFPRIESRYRRSPTAAHSPPSTRQIAESSDRERGGVNRDFRLKRRRTRLDSPCEARRYHKIK
jgi:hypothetical protein